MASRYGKFIPAIWEDEPESSGASKAQGTPSTMPTKSSKPTCIPVAALLNESAAATSHFTSPAVSTNVTAENPRLASTTQGVVDLTNSDDEEEIAEIAPNNFTPSRRAPRAAIDDFYGTSARTQMPGAYPTPLPDLLREWQCCCCQHWQLLTLRRFCGSFVPWDQDCGHVRCGTCFERVCDLSEEKGKGGVRQVLPVTKEMGMGRGEWGVSVMGAWLEAMEREAQTPVRGHETSTTSLLRDDSEYDEWIEKGRYDEWVEKDKARLRSPVDTVIADQEDTDMTDATGSPVAAASERITAAAISGVYSTASGEPEVLERIVQDAVGSESLGVPLTSATELSPHIHDWTCRVSAKSVHSACPELHITPRTRHGEVGDERAETLPGFRRLTAGAFRHDVRRFWTHADLISDIKNGHKEPDAGMNYKDGLYDGLLAMPNGRYGSEA